MPLAPKRASKFAKITKQILCFRRHASAGDGAHAIPSTSTSKQHPKMSTRVWNSAVLGAPIESVWKLVRCMRFDYHPDVRGATFCEGDADKKMGECGVGHTACIEYKDGTMQRLKTMALSDADHSVSWDLISSVPDGSMPFLGASHTVQLRRVTQDNTTFIEWATTFSKVIRCLMVTGFFFS